MLIIPFKVVLIVAVFILLISSCGVIEIRDKGKSMKERNFAYTPSNSSKALTVSLKRNESTINVNIEIDKAINYKLSTLKNPDRVTIDIYDNFNIKVSSLDKDIKYRVGYHPWGVRLVIDTPYANVYDQRTSFGISIVISLPNLEVVSNQANSNLPQTDSNQTSPIIPKVKLPVKGTVERAERGVFIKTSCNEFFRAVEDGKVIYSGNSLKQYDWVVMINQKDGFISVYAKAENSFVKKGEIVKKSQVLGKVGRSGDSCGILYELRTEDGSPIRFEVLPD